MLERTGAKRKEYDKQEKISRKCIAYFVYTCTNKGNVVFIFLTSSLSGYFPVKQFLIYLNKKYTKIYIIIFQHSYE